MNIYIGSKLLGEHKTKPPNRVVFCFGSLSLISNQRQSRATGSSNVVGTDGENAVLLAKFGRSDRKQFSSTWLACKTSLLIQVVAGSATRQSALRTPLDKTCHRHLLSALTQQGGQNHPIGWFFVLAPFL